MSCFHLTIVQRHLRLTFVIIRPRTTTHLVPFIQEARNYFAFCICKAHGHFILANGMELAEHCAKDTALRDLDNMFQFGFFDFNDAERMRRHISDTFEFGSHRLSVHPDIVRRTDEWNRMREQNEMPYPNDAHAFIVGGTGFRTRAYIAKTVPLSREPQEYVLIAESDIPSPYSAATP